MPLINATVPFQIDEIVDHHEVSYLASCPPDRRTSLYGSGFPFANREQAMSDTPNTGVVKLDKDNRGTLQLLHPNAYYNEYFQRVEPRVELHYRSNGCHKVKFIRLEQLIIPNRSLF